MLRCCDVAICITTRRRDWKCALANRAGLSARWFNKSNNNHNNNNNNNNTHNNNHHNNNKTQDDAATQHAGREW